LQGSLLSISALCDDECEVLFTRNAIVVKKHEKVLLQGKRDDNGLWSIPLQPPQIQYQANQTIAHATHAEFVRFVYLLMGAPVHNTFITAVRNGYLQYPGLHESMILKNLPASTATAKGHLKRTSQGLHSTKIYGSDETFTDSETQVEIFPTIRTPKPKTLTWTTAALSLVRTGSVHTDASGKLPVAGMDGANYVLIMFCLEANYIHVEPLKSRSAAEYVTAYTKGHDFFSSKGFTTKYMHLDNETSGAVEHYLRNRQIDYQFTPPDTHRTNRAERAIQTFKNHFISMLCLTDPTFPVGAWPHLLWMAEFTLNTMRGSGITPSISAWHQLHGHYDWNSHPVAVAGTRVLAFETPEQRSSWAPHGVDGWFIAPALQHYRCFDVLIKHTMSVRTTLTLQWYPADYVLPGGDPLALVTAAIDNLIDCVTMLKDESNACHNSTYMNVSDALQQCRQIFCPHAQENSMTEECERLPRVRNESNSSWTQVTRRKRTKTIPTPDQRSLDLEHVEGEMHTNTQSRVNEETTSNPFTHLPDIDDTVETVPATSDQPYTLQPSQLSPDSTDHGTIQVAETRGTRRNRIANPRYASLMQTIDALEQAISDNTVLPLHELHPHTPVAYTAVDMDLTGKVLNYRTALLGPDRDAWLKASEEEFERLMVTTKTITFINYSDVPTYNHVAYYNPQIKTKTENHIKKYRVRGTIGGDQLPTDDPVAAATASMTTIKTFFNVVVSEDAELMTADIKDFYLNTTLPQPVYMVIPAPMIPPTFISKHNIGHLIHNGKYYVRVDKGIYGLPQAGRLAQERLLAHLASHGYHQTSNTSCLFKHDSDDIYFTLVVDDFAIKYSKNVEAVKLINVLKELYEVHEDWAGSTYLGYDIERDRSKHTIALSLPKYIDNALKRFNINQKRGARTPMVYTPPHYGAKQQLTPDKSMYTNLTPAGKKRIEQIVGVLLYYARALDPTMLLACNKISTKQANPTTETAEWAERLLLYANTYPNAKLIYRASDLILKGASDASYLGDDDAQSRAGGYWYLGDKDNNEINGHILCLSKLIPAIVASAGEAEYAALFLNAQEAESIRNTLADFGYPQQATPILSDNSFATNLANDAVKQKRSKAIDMRWHWIRERVRNKHFEISWTPGTTNIADFFTKALPVSKFNIYKKQIIHSPEKEQQQANLARIAHQNKWYARFKFKKFK
jgi:hypothetical protein